MSDDEDDEDDKAAVNEVARGVVFEERELEKLQSWARFMLAAESIGSAANTIKQVLIWLATVAGLYLAYRSGHLGAWLAGVGK